MLCETVYLREKEGDKSVSLETYVCRRAGDMTETARRPAVIILPGGAYCFLAEREAEPIAKAYLAAGFNAFVLYYSIGEGKAEFPRPVRDVSMAIAYVRRHAEEFNTDPDRIFVEGSSAGGHLAGSIGTFWNRDWAAFDGMEKGENKPAGVILSYPVTTMGEYGHELCRNLVCGNGADDEEVRRAYSLECQVTEDTVPHFIWQTATDDCVDIQNSILLTEALTKAKVPVELHIFPKGPHGMSICTKEVESGNPVMVDPHIGSWVKLSVEFMERI